MKDAKRCEATYGDRRHLGRCSKASDHAGDHVFVQVGDETRPPEAWHVLTYREHGVGAWGRDDGYDIHLGGDEWRISIPALDPTARPPARPVRADGTYLGVVQLAAEFKTAREAWEYVEARWPYAGAPETCAPSKITACGDKHGAAICARGKGHDGAHHCGGLSWNAPPRPTPSATHDALAHLDDARAEYRRVLTTRPDTIPDATWHLQADDAQRAVIGALVRVELAVREVAPGRRPDRPEEPTPGHVSRTITQRNLCAMLGLHLEGLTISEAYNGIGFVTDAGLFGVRERDGGIEVGHDGRTVWSSSASVGPGDP